MPEMLSLSTVDYPGLPACVIFFRGCPFKCPFCHNPGLLEPEENVNIDELFQKVRGSLKLAGAVVFGGGEPLMSAEAVEKIASMVRHEFTGAKIKLDTNGFYPRELHLLLREGLLDFVALDFKSSPEQYENGTVTSFLMSSLRNLSFPPMPAKIFCAKSGRFFISLSISACVIFTLPTFARYTPFSPSFFAHATNAKRTGMTSIKTAIFLI